MKITFFKGAVVGGIAGAVMAAATAALATTFGFTLGTTNRVDAATKVTNLNADGTTKAAVNAPLMTFENKSTGTGATALNLNVAANKPPLTVNSTAGKATNLNADKLDGLDSTAFARSDCS